MTHLAALVLLTLGIAVETLACAGLVASRGLLARLHYAGLGSVVGPVLVLLAVGVEEGLSGSAVRAAVAAAFVIVTSPILTAAAADTWARRRGDEPETGGEEGRRAA